MEMTLCPSGINGKGDNGKRIDRDDLGAGPSSISRVEDGPFGKGYNKH